MRINYLIWSGGCDSTLLLDDLLQNASEKNPLRVISIEADFLSPIQLKKEKEAREKIKIHYELKPVNFITLKFNVDAPPDDFKRDEDRNYGLGQVTFWLGAVLPYIKNHCDIYFGYIKEDCFWHYRHYVDNIILNMAYINGLDDVKIQYPYEWYPKRKVIKELKERNLFDMAWYCEEPTKDGKVCNDCGSCTLHNISLKYIELEEQKSKNKSKKINENKITK